MTNFSIKLNNFSDLAISNISFSYKKETDLIKIPIVSSSKTSNEILTVLYDSIISNSDSKNPFIIEIFCEYVLTNGKTYIAYNKLNIYSSKSNLGNTQVVSDLISTIPSITENMSQIDIASTLKVLDQLNKLSTISTNNTISITTNVNTNTKSKTEINTPICNENSCNKRGSCIALLNSIACKCDEKFAGVNCEFSKDTAQIIKNITLSMVNNLGKKIISSSQNNISEITPELLNNVGKNIENAVKVLDNMEEAKSLKDILINLLDVSNKKENSFYEMITNNTDVFVNSLSDLFTFTTLQIGKTKMNNNAQSKRLNIKSANSIFDQLSIEENNKIIYVDKNDYKNYLFVNHGHIEGDNVSNLSINSKKFNNLRLIQSVNNSPNSTDKNSSDSNGTEENYDLNDLQKLDFLKYYSNVTSLLIKLGQNVIKGYLLDGIFFNSVSRNSYNNYNTTFNILNYSQTNDNFDLIIKQIPSLNSSNSKTENLFKERINSGLSYIDAYDCIKNFVESTNRNTTIFLIYLFVKNPIYIIDMNISNKSLSMSHYFDFFDSDANLIDLSICNKEILHYIPLQSRNEDFIRKFNLYPRKYFLETYNTINNKINITDINASWKNTYDKYMILNDGTVDKNTSISYQLDKYYLQYKLNFIFYNTNATNSSNIFINSIQENYVKTLDQNNYIIASSRKTGEFSVLGEYNTPTEYTGPKFYLYRNELFTLNNFTTNTLSKILIALISSNYLIVIIIGIYYLINSNSEDALNEDSHVELELTTLKLDNDIFGDIQDRYSLYNYFENYRSKFQQNQKNDLYKNHNENNVLIINNNSNNQSIPENSNNAITKKKDYTSDHVKINFNGELKQNRNIKNEYEGSALYSLYHFVIKRNIFSCLILHTSLFSPKYKSVTKVFTLYFLELTIVNFLYIFSSIQFDVN